MSKEWETEDEEIQKPPPKLGFEVKAFLVLVDSDKEDWGIVEDTLNDLLWVSGKGEIVGSWSRAPYDGLIHLAVGTSLSALQDRSTQTFAKYAEERRQQAAGAKKPRRGVRKAELAQEGTPLPEVPLEETLKFNAMRARLGRAK